MASGLEDQFFSIPARGPCLNWRVQWFWGGTASTPRKICYAAIPKGHFCLFSNHQFAGALAVSFKEGGLFFFVVVPRFIVARLEDCRICRVVYPSVGGQGASLYRWCGFLASGHHRMNHDPFPWLDHNPFNMIIDHDVTHEFDNPWSIIINDDDSPLTIFNHNQPWNYDFLACDLWKMTWRNLLCQDDRLRIGKSYLLLELLWRRAWTTPRMGRNSPGLRPVKPV